MRSKYYVLDIISAVLASGALILAPSTAAIAQSVSPEKLELARMQGVITVLKQRLLDPASAQISLPYGFTPQLTTVEALGEKITAYFTCGTVNSRNRMGGYVGPQVFLGIINQSGQVGASIDSAKYPMLGRICEQLGLPGLLPSTLQAISATAGPASALNVADELAKLANLRDKGVLSEQEFQTQKAKLLGGTR